MKRLSVIACLLILIAFTWDAHGGISAEEKKALTDLHSSADGENWADNTNWLTGEACTWHGVTCDDNDHVTELVLKTNQLTGTLPTSLGNLQYLERLDVGKNALTGSFPSFLGNMPNLKILSLRTNQFTGNISSDLGNLSNLEQIDLNSNQFSGPIPASLGNLPNLKTLYVWGNQLTGTIPSELGNLSALKELYLDQNQLTGTIPSELGNLSNLKLLFLGYNQLTGTIPPTLGNLSSLEILQLSDNQLTGTIPTSLGNIPNLRKLYLNDNQLTGTIPSELCTSSSLIERLRLENNDLTGPVPPEIMNLPNLQEGKSDFRGNHLHTSDPDVLAFLNEAQIDGDWESHQTPSDNGTPPENGYIAGPDLWIRAVIDTVEKDKIEAVWKEGGRDITQAGDTVIWGYFHADSNDVTWGSEQNPDLFVKIWFDRSGRVDVNFFHVSVPDIEVWSDYPHDGTPDEHGITTLDRRYVRQYYLDGQSDMDGNDEDGNPPAGYLPTNNPSGYSTINDLRIGAVINTVEKGSVDAVWRKGGEDVTEGGHQVLWGHFYASPSDVNWGSKNNPDLFVKIWFDVSGRVDVNYFHVSVPDIEVYSDLPDDKTYDQKGTTIMDNRYVRHVY